MQTVAILSGNFTGANNFSGYNASGKRIHVPARQLENLGINKDTKIQYPLYALVVEREFDVLDENSNPTGEKFKREQAGSIFLNKTDMINAVNADKLLTIEAHADLQSKAKASNLTDDAMSALLSVA
jgi:hypothetical protein